MNALAKIIGFARQQTTQVMNQAQEMIDKIDAETHTALVTKFYIVTNTKAIVDSMVEKAKQISIETGGDPEIDNPRIEKFESDYTQGLINALTETYTSEELVAMIELYSTEIGQSICKKNSTIAKIMTDNTEQIVQSFLKDMTR